MKPSHLQAVRNGISLYSPEEEIVLQTYFGLKAPDKKLQQCIDACLPEHNIYGEGPRTELNAAVATIVLETVEHDLPCWGYTEGPKVTLARQYRSPEQLKVRKLGLKPQHLFTINWANSGPGYSWPESYWITWVPGFDQHVLTSSLDCPDAHGYTDFALGHFEKEQSILEAARVIITEQWSLQKSDYGQEGWEEFWGGGELTDCDTAIKWRNEVWPEKEDDDAKHDKSDTPAPVITGAKDRLSWNDYIQLYRDAQYWVEPADSERVHFRIDEYSAGLERILQSYSEGEAAFLTANNPHSQILTVNENDKRQGELIAKVERLGLEWLPGAGASVERSWPEETSLLAIGISQAQANRLAEDFQQFAFVWISKSCKPKLVISLDTGNMADLIGHDHYLFDLWFRANTVRYLKRKALNKGKVHSYNPDKLDPIIEYLQALGLDITKENYLAFLNQDGPA